MASAADPSEERVPLGRKIWAGALGLSLLAMTYVLFDPDLGTRAPLFGELTCRGEIEIEILRPANDTLPMPDAGISFRASDEGRGLHSLVALELRRAGGDWERDQELEVFPEKDGADLFYVPQVEPGMHARLLAIDIEGNVCRAYSRTLQANG